MGAKHCLKKHHGQRRANQGCKSCFWAMLTLGLTVLPRKNTCKSTLTTTTPALFVSFSLDPLQRHTCEQKTPSGHIRALFKASHTRCKPLNTTRETIRDWFMAPQLDHDHLSPAQEVVGAKGKMHPVVSMMRK